MFTALIEIKHLAIKERTHNQCYKTYLLTLHLEPMALPNFIITTLPLNNAL